VDITNSQRIYPACRTYPWERVGANAQGIKFWQDTAIKAKRVSKNPRATVAWNKTLEHLEDLAGQFGKKELTPAQFKAVLLLAASEAQWYQAPSGRKGFNARIEGEPDKRRCSRCMKIKDRKDFRAEASDKRKIKYNWGRDGTPTADKRFLLHALCSSCRAERTRKPKSKRGEVRGAKLRAQMEPVLKNSRVFLSKFENDDPESIVDQRYYFHKRRVDAIQQARAILDKLEITADPMPVKWQMLLPQDVRQRLLDLFQDAVLPMWSGKGKQPKCF